MVYTVCEIRLKQDVYWQNLKIVIKPGLNKYGGFFSVKGHITKIIVCLD